MGWPTYFLYFRGCWILTRFPDCGIVFMSFGGDFLKSVGSVVRWRFVSDLIREKTRLYFACGISFQKLCSFIDVKIYKPKIIYIRSCEMYPCFFLYWLLFTFFHYEILFVKMYREIVLPILRRLNWVTVSRNVFSFVEFSIFLFSGAASFRGLSF